MSEKHSKVANRLKAYIARFLPVKEDVDEIAQEAFLRVLQAESKWVIKHPKAYLYRAARNLALNKLNSTSYQVTEYLEELLGAEAAMESITLERQAMSKQQFESFCRAVAQLPEQCRRVLVYRKVYGYSQREVAEKLGISISTVEKHLVKGMARCAKYLSEQDADDASIDVKKWNKQ